MKWFYLFLIFLYGIASADLSGNGLYDYQGKPLTTNLDSGSRNPLDVETMFGGSIVDPRARTWTLSSGTDSCSSVQSGIWSTGRTWNLSSGSDSVASVQSGPWTVTVNQGTPGPTASPWPVTVASPLPITGTVVITGPSPLPVSGSVNISSFPSPLPVSQSGPWIVAQGTPGPTASPWPVTITALPSPVPVSQSGALNITNISGTVSLPTGAATSANQTTLGNQTTKVNDGTNTMAVKAASTAALATDPSAVVALSPNSSLPTGSNNVGSITNITGTVSLPTGAALSANQTNGTAKTQQVDGSGNVQPSGDVLTRKIFVQPTDGSNNQAYTASGESKVLVTPLTNSSVVKAQLQDNSGTAITLGQTTMSAGVPVALASNQTGINTFLDKSGTGTISALNGAVTVTTNGMSTIAFSAQGIFSATLQVQGQAGDGAWVSVVGYVPGTGNTATVLTGASMLIFPIGGFNQVRLIAIAYTSGTANIQYNLGAGVQGTQVFNLTPASLTGQMGGLGADGSTIVGNPVRVAGKDGSGNTQDILTDTAGNQAVLLKDVSANGITSTAISGTATNKQPLDVNSLSTGTARYFTEFATQQTAGTAANATVFAMRNAAASTKTVILENIYCRQGFNPTNPVTRTQQSYIFQRFSAATPTGGTALTAGLGDSSDAASQVTDVRFLDTGLTTTGVTFVANNLGAMVCDTTQGITCQEPVLNSPSAWRFAPGEGLAIRLGVIAVTGVSISCNLAWREQ